MNPKFALTLTILSFISSVLIIGYFNNTQQQLNHLTQQETSSVCRFAFNYNTQDFNSQQKVDSFIADVIQWERKFIRQIGVHQKTGLTYDGYRLDVNSGQILVNGLHYWTASSKQSIHLGVMAKVLEGDKLASTIYSSDEVFDLIARKVKTLELFNKTYPGFAGYLPWVYLKTKDTQIPQPTSDFKNQVPALDNGEMFWGALSLSQAWKQKHPQIQPELRQRFDQITWRIMVKNMRRVFFNQTTKKIRAVSSFTDPYKSPTENTYTNKDNYYLDDPYQGQLYAWMITLFGKEGGQFTQQQIDNIWVQKRKKLQSAEYQVHAHNLKPVTVEKGYWFSAHQQWKNLFMPYYLSPTYKQIQKNNQIARTWHSVDKVLVGMYASVTGLADTNDQDTGYFSDCGIQQISFQKVGHLTQVTPYSAFPLFLLDKKIGAMWMHNMIHSPAGQTKYGATQSTSIDGTRVSPILTWDTKITTVLAILKGTTQLVERYLSENNLLDDFKNRLQSEYSSVFKDIKGTDLQYAKPRVKISKGRNDFTTCKK